MSEERVPDEQRTVSSDDVAAAAGVSPFSVADLSDNGGLDSLHKQELDFTEDELRRTLETIASTGKFWVGWDKLKSMLSFKLKQVLSEYNEGKMTIEEQNSSLGETYPGLVQRLDEALLSFDEGPPFTLQRLCEILLTAQTIYPKLSKLALALEKNLLVSSMLTSCGDPSLNTATTNMLQEEIEGPKKSSGESGAKACSNEENGVDNTVISVPTTDRDEAMVDVEPEEAKDEEEEEEEEEKEEVGISSMDMEEATTALDEVAASASASASASADADTAPLPSESEMKSSE